MNYIILDLEWDSAYCHKKNGFVNQIIQIGAVKLDSNFKFIDRIEILVKSCISKKVTRRFTELTGITTDQMKSGISLKAATEKYNEWVGEDIITMTWSNSDLYAIVENAKLFADGLMPRLERYADLQKYVQSQMKREEQNKNQISLADAAEHFNISVDSFDLHTAADDSMLAAKLLKLTYKKDNFEAFVKDATNPEFFERLAFKNYYLSNINDKNINPADLDFYCDKCGVKATRTKKWGYRNHWFTSEFFCSDCNEKFIGRLSFKKTYSSLKVSRRILRKPKAREKNEVSV